MELEGARGDGTRRVTFFGKISLVVRVEKHLSQFICIVVVLEGTVLNSIKVILKVKEESVITFTSLSPPHYTITTPSPDLP